MGLSESTQAPTYTTNIVMWLTACLLPLLVTSRSKTKNASNFDRKNYRKVTVADLSLQIEHLRHRIDELEKINNSPDFLNAEVTNYKRSKRNSWQNVKVKFPRSVIENVCKNNQRGIKGEPGKCPSKCMRGQKGERGSTGKRGPTGVDGQKGVEGCKGDRGRSGGQGQRGLIGRKGSAGRSGLQGARGFPGPQGQKGCAGVCEMSYCGRGGGARGPPGKRGPPGLDGRPGETGKVGEKGDSGLPGERGRDGDSGEVGPPGASGINGERGPVGAKG